jgi:TonB family protein
VILEATIDVQGNVAELEVLRGEPVLQQPALEAVSQWKYRPATLNGAAVPVVMMVTVTFSIGTTRMALPPPGLDPQMLGRGGGGGGSGMGGGVGIGPVPVTLTITQDKDRARITRPWQNKSETLTYRLDGKPSKSRVRSMGGAVGDAEVIFESRWDGPKLVTTMTWRSPVGLQQRTETMAVEGEILTVQITRPALAAGGEPTVRTAYYMRKAK